MSATIIPITSKTEPFPAGSRSEQASPDSGGQHAFIQLGHACSAAPLRPALAVLQQHGTKVIDATAEATHCHRSDDTAARITLEVIGDPTHLDAVTEEIIESAGDITVAVRAA